MKTWNGGQARGGLLGVFLALIGGETAWTAGGAHVVDDATVETPGTCHVEVWATRFGPARGLVNASPACTRGAWPRLELGASILHSADRKDDTMVGPAFKLNLRSVEKGLDVGVGATGGWSLHTGRLETASAVAPLALQLSEHLRVNLNGGWLYSRLGNHRHMAFVGAQVERQLTSKLSLMVEAFNRDRGRAGGQIGLRWTPGEGTVDLDIMAGHRLDGVGRSAITLGLTLRN